MSLLEYDPWTFGPESRPITKEDIKAAFEIMKEVTGEFSFWNWAEKLATLNVWIPGLGIPISAGLAGECLTEMEKYMQIYRQISDALLRNVQSGYTAL